MPNDQHAQNETGSENPAPFQEGSQTTSSTRMSPREFAESMRQQTDTFLEDVMKTVNEAPDDEWIEGFEEGVRDLAAEFRKNVFQAAVQGRVDAAEAAFSPSTGDSDGPRDATAGDQKSAE